MRVVSHRDAIARKIERRLELIKETIVTQAIELAEWDMHRGCLGEGAKEADRAQWERVTLPMHWVGEDSTVWFRCRMDIPAELRNRQLALYLFPGGESLVYINGRPWQGIDENHRFITFASGDGTVDVTVETWSGQERSEHVFAPARLAVLNREISDTLTDFEVALDAAKCLDGEAGIYLLEKIDEALSVVDLHEVGPELRHLSKLRIARENLWQKVYGCREFRTRGKVALLGQSHLDVAWLWRIRETYRKSRRTFSTALRLMEEYPEYRFAQSTPALYAALKEHSPDIFSQIRERVREGRWELVGGMWVEPDGNMPSGESLVRQFLEGKKFLQEEFGVEPRVSWLPDTFGYTHTWPQIMKKAGIDYFMTTKMFWNQTNAMPHSTFWWQGLDGSRVGAHMVPVLNSEVDAPTIVKAWKMMNDKDLSEATLLLYGYGDGGGGPIRKQVEWASRLRNFPGLPETELTLAHDFFDKYVGKPLREAGAEAPVWNGELYLELHRGTLTSQSRVKRANRKAEALYHSTDLFAAWAWLLGGNYPGEVLREGWRGLLTNQFHDILPGSSIHEVYEDALHEYARIFELGRGVLSQSLEKLGNDIDTEGPGTPLIVFNPLSSERTDIVQVSLSPEEDVQVIGPQGEVIRHQWIEGDLPVEPDDWEKLFMPQGGKGRKIAFEATVSPLGYEVYRVVPAKRRREEEYGGGLKVEQLPDASWSVKNQFYELVLSGSGRITRLYDRGADRDVIAPGKQANILQAFEDKPNRWDAWDIDDHYRNKMWEVGGGEVELLQSGPVFAVLRAKSRFRNSLIIQDIVVYSGLPRIDFKTYIDWHEQNTLLKAAFPIDVHADKATYDIAFGHIERPTHRSTTWDEARFEVSGHKWADIAEWGYGVSLLNDSKYGYDTFGSTIRLTLLKSATWPDPIQDQGVHFFTYSLFPHRGNWREAGVEKVAAGLNIPLVGLVTDSHPGRLGPSGSLAVVDSPNIVIEAVKRAEDGDGIILRLVERFGQRGTASVKAFFPVGSAVLCDLLEREERQCEVRDDAARVEFKPYEILTLKLVVDHK